ncbi:UNVERIFIED_CONTAM: hypothetical protein FKN15_014058 [Acipenser sinensis]
MTINWISTPQAGHHLTVHIATQNQTATLCIEMSASGDVTSGTSFGNGSGKDS